MTTDEMLIEIVNYKYKSFGFPYVGLFSITKVWLSFGKPAEFSNKQQTEASTVKVAEKL
jgi:hypothetical protein